MRPAPLVAIAAALLTALPAAAQTVSDACDWRASPVNIAEPWEAHSRSFANGAIRIALLDTEEPACCAFHLLVLSPPGSDEGPGWRQCHIVTDTAEGQGFMTIDFPAITASYDPARGLRLDVPFRRYSDDGRGQPGSLAVRINQATGSVVLE